MSRRLAILAVALVAAVGALGATSFEIDPFPDLASAAHSSDALDGPGEATAEPAAEDPASASSGDRFDAFTMRGCRESFAHVEVPASRLEPQLPDGFEPVPPPFSPGVGVRPTGWFVAVTSHCDAIVYDGQGADEMEVSDNQRLWYAAAVDPPDALEDADVDVYFYPFRFVVAQEASAEVLDDWGQHVDSGSVELTRQASDVDPWIWGVEAESDDVAYELDARGAVKPDFHEPLVRLFAHPSDGSVDQALDMQPQGNTRYSYATQLDLDLDAPDSPFPGPMPREPVDGNLKHTPSGEVALEGELVTFEGR